MPGPAMAGRERGTAFQTETRPLSGQILRMAPIDPARAEVRTSTQISGLAEPADGVGEPRLGGACPVAGLRLSLGARSPIQPLPSPSGPRASLPIEGQSAIIYGKGQTYLTPCEILDEAGSDDPQEKV